MGSTEDLPDLPRGTASADTDVRGEAVHELFGTVWYEGTARSATPHAGSFVASPAAVAKSLTIPIPIHSNSSRFPPPTAGVKPLAQAG